MSLDKAIDRKKEKRKPFYGSKAFDKTCRCHGSCEWCKASRLYKFEKDKPVDDDCKVIPKRGIMTSILSTSVDESFLIAPAGASCDTEPRGGYNAIIHR